MNGVRFLCAVGLMALTSLGAAAETLEERFETTLPFASGSTLELTNTNGSVTVEAWEGEQVAIVADKKVRADSQAEARKLMDELEIVIDETAGGIAVETRVPKRGERGWFSRHDGSASVSYSIRVPRSANLDLQTVNGKIGVEGVHGELELGSTNGGIRALHAGGSVDAHTTNGGIEVELATITDGEEMSFRTTNGPIEVSLPAHLAADLTARTTNGSIRTDFPVTVQGSFAKNRLEGAINGGGPSIELRTTNGSIHIREI